MDRDQLRAGPLRLALVATAAVAQGGCAGVPALLETGLTVHFTVVATIAITLGLLHLLLFAFETRDRRNLFLAALALSFALVVVLDYRDRIGARVMIPVLGPLQSWAVSALILSAARFAFSLFRERAPRRLAVYVGTVLVLLLLSIVDSRFWDVPASLLGITITFDALLTVLRGWRGLKREAWIVALGAGIFSIGGLAQLSLELFYRPSWGDVVTPYLWGGLALLISSSIYLARTFAGTRRELEQRLVEVEELSARTLAQERAARDDEVKRRLLEAENERRREELESARQLQVAMLPAKLPEIDRYKIAASMITATEVGGDYYDAVESEDGSLWVTVGDAVGHGVRAGTLVTITKSLYVGSLLSSSRIIGTERRLSPSEALERFDGGFKRMGLKRAHMALTLAHFRGGTLELASAGMPPTLVRRRDGRVEEITFSTLPLGSPLRQRYESRRLELEPGDLVLLTSDGLPELPLGDGGALGYDGVRDLVAGSADVDGDLDAWLSALVSGRIGDTPPPDDITLLAVRILPKAALPSD